VKYLDYNQNVEYYIEHLAPGTWLKKMLPDYCKPNIPSKVQNRSEVLSIVKKIVEQKNEDDKGTFDTLKEVDEQKIKVNM